MDQFVLVVESKMSSSFTTFLLFSIFERIKSGGFQHSLTKLLLFVTGDMYIFTCKGRLPCGNLSLHLCPDTRAYSKSSRGDWFEYFCVILVLPFALPSDSGLPFVYCTIRFVLLLLVVFFST